MSHLSQQALWKVAMLEPWLLTIVKAAVAQNTNDSSTPHRWRLKLCEGQQTLDHTPGTHTNKCSLLKGLEMTIMIIIINNYYNEYHSTF